MLNAVSTQPIPSAAWGLASIGQTKQEIIHENTIRCFFNYLLLVAGPSSAAASCSRTELVSIPSSYSSCLFTSHTSQIRPKLKLKYLKISKRLYSIYSSTRMSPCWVEHASTQPTKASDHCRGLPYPTRLEVYLCQNSKEKQLLNP